MHLTIATSESQISKSERNQSEFMTTRKNKINLCIIYTFNVNRQFKGTARWWESQRNRHTKLHWDEGDGRLEESPLTRSVRVRLMRRNIDIEIHLSEGNSITSNWSC